MIYLNNQETSFAKRILCFGDSNTWGQIPGTKSRMAINLSWPGKLQQLLGQKYAVISDGLPSRTTEMEYPLKPSRNGLRYFLAWIEAQTPADVLILFIGTNDLKEMYRKKPEEIAVSVEKYLIEATKLINKIVLLSPPVVDETNPIANEKYVGAYKKSLQLANHYQTLAQKHKCDFIDLAKLVSPSDKDGIHLDEAAHMVIAEEICKTIEIWSNN